MTARVRIFAQRVRIGSDVLLWSGCLQKVNLDGSKKGEPVARPSADVWDLRRLACADLVSCEDLDIEGSHFRGNLQNGAENLDDLRIRLP